MKTLIGASFTDEVSAREQENARVAYEAAVESIVLLRNDGCLPLQAKEIAIFGAGASHTIKGGTGSGEVNNRHSVSIYEGFRNAGITVSSENWIREYISYEKETHEGWIREHRTIPSPALLSLAFEPPSGRAVEEKDISASDKNVAMYIVSRRASEGYEQKPENGDFSLRVQELEDIRFLYERFAHLIVVINSGSVMDLSELDDLDISLIYLGYAGQEVGSALADLVTGKESFSAKLADTWMKKYEDVPYGNEYSVLNETKGNEYYREDIYVGYRYYDSFGIEPRFHFGFGLTYSSFDMKLVHCSVEQTKVNLQVLCENTGAYKGKEVAQVYVSCPQGKLAKEYQRLVAFRKTENLNPAEQQVLDICFDIGGCASFDEETGTMILEQGEYIVRVGNASNNTCPVAVIEVSETVILSKHDHIFPGYERFAMIEPPAITYQDDLTQAARLVFDCGCVKPETYTYGKPEIYSDVRVDAILNQLKNEELIDIVVGMGGLGMIDNHAMYVPGGVGKTTPRLMDKGLIPVVLADGPAGLRLVKKSGMTKRGGIRLYKDNYLISFMEVMPPVLLKLLAPSKKDPTLYQFCTAFPSDSTLAQCWNEELAEAVGYAVSREMDAYNITYWLAPGMNIHRNPLCGRNFEYYSEDPLLTGKISAAVTRGVQKIEGNYTTIKHFCCNNVSEESNMSNSHVSERALREIYLKGFEINIKEAGSKAVMTAYNKVNGIHASDSFDLCTKVLRNEWGFDGVVMTDWGATSPKDNTGHSDVAVANGNDLIMPGGSEYKKALAAGLKGGVVTRDDLKRAAANIIKSIVYSNVAKKMNRTATKN